MAQKFVLGQRIETIKSGRMNFTLLVCTYKRANALLVLLDSVKLQTLYPNEIIIVDGSPDDETKTLLLQNEYAHLQYFKVSEHERGLTKQRNLGITKVSPLSEVICFLDDDVVLETNYLEQLISTYTIYPTALGVGGYITNEIKWQMVAHNYVPKRSEFVFDHWKRLEGSRFVIRKILGLDTDRNPGCLPEFSHGRSISFLPPSGKIYEVEQLMGGVASFQKTVFDQFQFSAFFEGYGLYEDADFSLRVSQTGKLYVNTAARLAHYHHPSGRPNHFLYGKMVVQNGWYVWRVKYPNPSLNAVLKWHLITLLLILIRFINIFSTSKRKVAASEALGRLVGWLQLFFHKSKSQ
jgi:glycosyltransferase involved in cell wall biosynthesis